MSEFHTALSVDVEEDLLPLSALLRQRGVIHRVFEEGGRQVLSVQQAGQVGQVQALYRAWRAGDVSIELAGEVGSALELRVLGWFPEAHLDAVSKALRDMHLDGAVAFTGELPIAALIERVQNGEPLVGHPKAHTLILPEGFTP